MSHSRRLGAFAIGAVFCLAPRPSAAQVEAGPEFRVNTSTTGQNGSGVVAMSPQGDFVVTWKGPPGNLAQRFDASGARRGDEFRVDTGAYLVNSPVHSATAAAAGDFVVAWSATEPLPTDWEVVARRFGADGVPRGQEFRLNTYTATEQLRPSVAAFPDGGFVAAWASRGQELADFGIYAQRYDGNGMASGVEFHVNTFTSYVQTGPLVATSADGRFVVTWISYPLEGPPQAIHGQRYDAAGNAIGGEFQVNTTAGTLRSPSLAMAPDGRFVVAFHDYSHDGSGAGVRARRFDAAGDPAGDEFTVNSYTSGNQWFASVATDASGRFVVVWKDFGLNSLFGRRFTADGVPRGGEFRVNTYFTGYQASASVVSDEVGNIVVVWDRITETPTGQDFDVIGQRFGGLHPQALAVDTAGNSVWEPGEQVDVRPGWRNSTGRAQTFGADLSDLTGPAGATYSLVDGTGSYGTVADGVSASCSDCYVVGVSSPAQRPALDWDAVVAETLTPGAHDQRKAWRLHIGGSFADVPAASPFYRFVETLLHRGVSAGCGGGAYCPASSTTREQMAVFLLAAKEGAGYAPPACTTPVFADVPASSSFCRWIEELARRGVTAGCAPGLFCPAAPVTREQMAVFLLRTLDPNLNPPACTTPVFSDVPASSPFCQWIEELARRGVTAGCGGGNYCPTAAVTREQMAVFLTGTFGLTLYGP